MISQRIISRADPNVNTFRKKKLNKEGDFICYLVLEDENLSAEGQAGFRDNQFRLRYDIV